MTSRAKLNAFLLSIFVVALFLAAAMTYTSEVSQHRERVRYEAEVLLGLAAATRHYTSDDVASVLTGAGSDVFHPESVPSFAAQRVFSIFRQEFPLYAYREAATNPTNPKDLATPFEVELIRRFQEDPALADIFESKLTDAGHTSVLARPIRMTDESCLACHSTPEVAPAAMRERYGSAGGYGWQLGDVVAAQIISLPSDVIFERARQATVSIAIALAALFVVIVGFINLFIDRTYIRPLGTLWRAAEDFSLGKADLPDLPARRSDEIGALERALNRVKRSYQILTARADAAERRP